MKKTSPEEDCSAFKMWLILSAALAALALTLAACKVPALLTTTTPSPGEGIPSQPNDPTSEWAWLELALGVIVGRFVPALAPLVRIAASLLATLFSGKAGGSNNSQQQQEKN